MSDQPSVKISYSEPQFLEFQVRSLDDLRNALIWLGVLGRPTVYPGNVSSFGAAGTPFPSGWSVTESSTGTYVVTHNLNTTNYVVTATLEGLTAINDNAILTISAQTATTFTVSIASTTLSSINSAFNFILVVTP